MHKLPHGRLLLRLCSLACCPTAFLSVCSVLFITVMHVCCETCKVDRFAENMIHIVAGTVFMVIRSCVRKHAVATVQ